MRDEKLGYLSPVCVLVYVFLAQRRGVFTVSSAQTGENNKQTNPPFPSPPTTTTHVCPNSPHIAMETPPPPPRNTYYLSVTAASEGLVPRSPMGSDWVLQLGYRKLRVHIQFQNGWHGAIPFTFSTSLSWVCCRLYNSVEHSVTLRCHFLTPQVKFWSRHTLSWW